MLGKLTDAYKMWHECFKHLPRLTRYSLGMKIDNLFTEIIEVTLLARYAPREQKAVMINKASSRLDALKYFLQVAWEIKALDHKKYASLTAPLREVGKMYGGWLNMLGR